MASLSGPWVAAMVCVTNPMVMITAIVSKGKEGNESKDKNKEERHAGERQEVMLVSRGADREILQPLPLTQRNLRQIIGAWAQHSRHFFWSWKVILKMRLFYNALPFTHFCLYSLYSLSLLEVFYPNFPHH